jgi:hypothetical protein
MGREVKGKATKAASTVAGSSSKLKKRQVPRNGSDLLEWQKAAIIGCLSNDYVVDVKELQGAFIKRKQSIRNEAYKRCLKVAQGSRGRGFLRSTCIEVKEGSRMPMNFIRSIVNKVEKSLGAGKNFSV